MIQLSLLNGVYAGLGQSLGSILGGYCTKQLGTAKLFTYCAVANVIVFLIYALGYVMHTVWQQRALPTTTSSSDKVNTRLVRFKRWFQQFRSASPAASS